MTTRLPQPPIPTERSLRWAAILFAVGWGVHVARSSASRYVGVAARRHGRRHDPGSVRRGRDPVGGHRAEHRAPEWAIGVGFGSAVLFTYAHLMPSFFPAYQDSFVSGPRINVTWFSWVSAAAEIGTGGVFAVAGLRARPSRVGSVVQLLRRRVAPMNDSGTLFFDGACGMCTRSKDLLLRFDRTGNIATEPLQSPGVAERLGVAPATLLDAVRWLDPPVTPSTPAPRPPTPRSPQRSAPESRWRCIGFPVSASSRTLSIGGWSRTVTGSPGTTPYCESHPAAC